MFVETKRINFAEIEKYRLPVYASKGKEKFVYFYVLDPQSVVDGCPKLKRIRKKFNGYKSKRERDAAATRFCFEVSKRLQSGWNPLIHEQTSRSFTPLEEVLEKYLKCLQKMVDENSFKRTTLVQYMGRIKQLRAWNAEQQFPVKFIYQFDKAAMENFLEYIYIGHDTTSLTRNNYLTWLSSFCGWLVSYGYMQSNPAEKIKKLKEKDKFRKALSAADMRRLSDYLEKNDRYFLLACLLLYYAMIRPNEMRYLKIEDFRLKEQSVFISHNYSKNGKDAVVTLPRRVVLFMVELGVFSHPGSYYLFGQDFKPSPKMSDGRIFRIRWLKVRRELGFPEEYQFYSLKDTGISDAIDRVGLTVTKDQARHSNIATTNKYVRKDQMSVHPELKDFEGAL